MSSDTLYGLSSQIAALDREIEKLSAEVASASKRLEQAQIARDALSTAVEALSQLNEQKAPVVASAPPAELAAEPARKRRGRRPKAAQEAPAAPTGGSVRDAVEAILKDNPDWSTDQIVAALLAKGFDFGAKSPRRTVHMAKANLLMRTRRIAQ